MEQRADGRANQSLEILETSDVWAGQVRPFASAGLTPSGKKGWARKARGDRSETAFLHQEGGRTGFLGPISDTSHESERILVCMTKRGVIEYHPCIGAIERFTLFKLMQKLLGIF